MNTKRKIQLAAAVVIANGTLAAGLLSPSQVLADPSCTPYTACVPQATCAEHGTICLSHVPQGCFLQTSTCSYPLPTGCSAGTYRMVCIFN
jgi:hypothetical protein